MNKFTIFTVILSVSVITVTADLAVRSYIGKNEQASVITAPAPQTAPPPQAEPPASTDDSQITSTPPPVSSVQDFTATIKEAGFTGAVSEEHFNGKVFQLLDITKIPVIGISFHQISDNNQNIASVTEITLQDEIRALQLYVLLQNKTKTYIDLSVNETNAYGDRSFYINHAKKPDEAFLVTKIRKTVYAFAYVKAYHPQVKKLIALLST